MAKKKYYAWITPAGSGICQSWAECQAACAGYKNIKNKGFSSYEEAWQFIHPDIPCPSDNGEVTVELTTSQVDTEIFTEDVENTSSDLSVPISSYDVPISEEVNAYCMRYNFSKLSDRQKMAVQSIEGKTLLFAVPGSGKTTVIIARTGYMVYSKNINPRSIISLTFTKAAADEMITRFKAHFNTEIAPDFRTIHSMCYSIILPRLRRAGFAIPTHLLGAEDDIEEEKPLTASSVFRALFKRIKRQPTDFETAMEAVQCAITGIKNSVMGPSAYEYNKIKIDGIEISIKLLFDTYREILKELDCMDFDDLLIYAYKGLKKYPSVLLSLQQQYKYWSIDEAQDTSKLQFMLLDLLLGVNGNVFMVGDDDQSIYSFRGANPKHLRDFSHRAGVITLLMGINYRSDYEIVSVAKHFIESNQNRAEKEMRAFSSRPGIIHIPQALHTEASQYGFILKASEEAITQNETLAVLYRRNISCFPLIVYLHQHGIPYEANKGIAEILRSKHIKVIWKVFLFLLHQNSYSAFSACNTCLSVFPTDDEKEYLKKAHKDNKNVPILKLLYQHYKENDDNEKAVKIKDLIMLLSQIQEMKPTTAAKTILSELHYWSSETINDRLRIYSFLSASDLFSSISDFVHCLQDIIIKEKKKSEIIDPTDFDNSLAAVTTALKPVVTLSSMHASKGREFSRVIIIDTFDEIMPGEKRDDALIYDPEEELRLFYVAVTRAEHRLDILTVDKYHGNTEKVSRFINTFAYLCEQCCNNARILESIPEAELVTSGTLNIEPQKYYAVKKGRTPGIYISWAECQKQVNEYSEAEYRCFSTREEAEEYLGNQLSAANECMSLRLFGKYIVSSEGPAFNYQIDLPSVVCDAIHRYFGVSTLSQIAPEILKQLRNQSNYMYSSNQITSYSESADAYTLTYMPVNFYKIWKPLWDLASVGLLKETYNVLELGAGPGTATMGLISFFIVLAASNPERHFTLDITAVEKEKSFQPLFELLITQLRRKAPSNMDISVELIHSDALGDFIYKKNRKYNLVMESNMLNPSEGVGEYSIEAFTKVLFAAMDESSVAVMIEPGTDKDKAFLSQLEDYIARDHIAESLISPKLTAVYIEKVTLYQEAIEAGLRGRGNTKHYFNYLVMRRGNQ